MYRFIVLISLLIFSVSGGVLKNKWWYGGGAIESCTKSRALALTFDDGPRWDYENILNILKRNNVKATFFVLGELLSGNFALTQRAFREGHTIASHSYSHPSLTSLGEDEIRQELSSTADLIQQATGVYPKYMRPPFGDFDDSVVSVANDLNQAVIMWNIDSLDWSDSSNAFNIIQQELGNEDSAIILMHDWTGMSEILQDIIDLAKERNFELVNMDGCLGESSTVTQEQDNWDNNDWVETTTVKPFEDYNTIEDYEWEEKLPVNSNYDYNPMNYDWYEKWRKGWQKKGGKEHGHFLQN